MPDHAETFAQVGSQDAIRNEIWRLTDRMGDSLRSILFADDEDVDQKAMLEKSLDEFSTELASRFPKWIKGQSVEKVEKAHFGHITKVDEEQQIVFGWFNVVMKADGVTPLVDLQDDVIEPGELEKAAYEFVLESREGGVMHSGDPNATLIESMVFTPDKSKAMMTKSAGCVQMHVPPGWWWGGFKIHDAAVFDQVKKGELAMFSFEGTAQREEITA